jgi:hypothetical protein
MIALSVVANFLRVQRGKSYCDDCIARRLQTRELTVVNALLSRLPLLQSFVVKQQPVACVARRGRQRGPS